MYVTEIESPYHDSITVSSNMIEISRIQVIIETKKYLQLVELHWCNLVKVFSIIVPF